MERNRVVCEAALQALIVAAKADGVVTFAEWARIVATGLRCLLG